MKGLLSTGPTPSSFYCDHKAPALFCSLRPRRLVTRVSTFQPVAILTVPQLGHQPEVYILDLLLIKKNLNIFFVNIIKFFHLVCQTNGYPLQLPSKICAEQRITAIRCFFTIKCFTFFFFFKKNMINVKFCWRLLLVVEV